MSGRYETFAEELVDDDGARYQAGLPFLELLYTGKIVWKTIRTDEAMRPDLIAAKVEVLSDPDLFWVICELNGIIDPFVEIAANSDIVIPVSRISMTNDVKATTFPTRLG